MQEPELTGVRDPAAADQAADENTRRFELLHVLQEQDQCSASPPVDLEPLPMLGAVGLDTRTVHLSTRQKEAERPVPEQPPPRGQAPRAPPAIV